MRKAHEIIAYNPTQEEIERDWRGEYVARDSARLAKQETRAPLASVRAVRQAAREVREMSRVRFAALTVALFGAGLYLAPLVTFILF